MTEEPHILVTGATGFTGSHVVPLLLKRWGRVSCLVRHTSNRTPIDLPGVKFEVGDLDDPKTLVRALQGKKVLVNIAYLSGKGKPGERAQGIVDACEAAGVRRAIFVSSTSIYTSIKAPAKKGKLAAEAAIINSTLDYTILRPTMIYGTAGDRNMSRIIRFLQRSPCMFIPGNGGSQQQPIHVDDLAGALVNCLDLPITYRKAYNLSGARSLSFTAVIDEICKALAVRRVKIHVPVGPALWLARLAAHLPVKGLIKEEQIQRLNEDKDFDHDEARKDFGFRPRDFAQGIRHEVELLRSSN
jgi:uncharacterized protein YbjT (DUF2867 family)